MTADLARDPAFPTHGRRWQELEQQLIRAQAGDLPFTGGVFERYWPAQPSAAYLAGRAAAAMMAGTNAFVMADLPALAAVEAELRAMVAEILTVPAAGAVTLTAGGTESNFLALKAARERGRRLGIQAPNAVMPITAHPSFDKAGHELGIEVRRVAVGPDHRALARTLAAGIDTESVLVAASAPCYPQGVVDPIDEIADIAREHDLWMHVDACVGGFLVPFLRELGEPLPAFDFEVDGVWSVSADLHKFGFCLTGISTLSVRDASLQDLHTFTLGPPGWPYRGYTRVGFGGSRPGSVIAAAWAVLQILGRDGFRDIAANVRDTGAAVSEALRSSLDLRLLAPPEAGVLVLAPVGDLDVEGVAAELLAEGWDAATGVAPPSLHLLLSPVDLPERARFLEALTSAAGRVRVGTATAGRRSSAYGDDTRPVEEAR